MAERDALRELLDTTQTAAELLAKDAERYRWLRDQGFNTSSGFFSLSFYWPHDAPFDKAIDAAMQETQK